MNTWYTRPVWGVVDIGRSVDFYVGQLGFKEAWRYAEDDRPLIVQIGRLGCEVILSSQWPERVGQGLIFVSLDQEALDALRMELTARDVAVEEGDWGYRLMVVRDPDGNTLYFPYSADDAGEGEAA